MIRPRTIPVYYYPPQRALGAPLMTSTQDVDNVVGVLESNYKNLDGSIQEWYSSVEHTPAFDEFYNGWTNFKGQVDQFIHEWRTTGFSFLAEKLNPFSSNQPGPWVKLTPSYYDSAQNLNSQVSQWRSKFTSISGRVLQTPELEAPGGPLSQLGNYALLGGAFILALLVLRR